VAKKALTWRVSTPLQFPEDVLGFCARQAQVFDLLMVLVQHGEILGGLLVILGDHQLELEA
jgi:hypothetical protein